MFLIVSIDFLSGDVTRSPLSLSSLFDVHHVQRHLPFYRYLPLLFYSPFGVVLLLCRCGKSMTYTILFSSSVWTFCIVFIQRWSSPSTHASPPPPFSVSSADTWLFMLLFCLLLDFLRFTAASMGKEPRFCLFFLLMLHLLMLLVTWVRITLCNFRSQCAVNNASFVFRLFYCVFVETADFMGSDDDASIWHFRESEREAALGGIAEVCRSFMRRLGDHRVSLLLELSVFYYIV